MVSALVTLLFLAVFQVGLALHIRNTLISCASEGARSGRGPTPRPRTARTRTRELIGAVAVAAVRPRRHRRRGRAGGVPVVDVRVRRRCRSSARSAPTAASSRRAAPSWSPVSAPGPVSVRQAAAAASRPLARRAPGEAGSAVVEFVFLAVLLMVPLSTS